MPSTLPLHKTEPSWQALNNLLRRKEVRPHERGPSTRARNLVQSAPTCLSPGKCLTAPSDEEGQGGSERDSDMPGLNEKELGLNPQQLC